MVCCLGRQRFPVGENVTPCVLGHVCALPPSQKNRLSISASRPSITCVCEYGGMFMVIYGEWTVRSSVQADHERTHTSGEPTVRTSARWANV